MIWYYTPYALAPAVAALTSIIVAAMVWDRRGLPLVRAFLAIMGATAFWSLLNALELSNTTLLGKVALSRIQHIGIIAIPFEWLAFALIYAGRERWVSLRTFALPITIQAAVVVGIITNELHGLVWPRVELGYDASVDLFHLVVYYGPLWYAHAAVSYTLILIGTAIIFRSLLRSPPLYRGQAIAILVGVLLPWVTSLLYVTGHSPLPYVDLTPIAFAFSGVALMIGIARFKMLDVVPAARDAAIESMGDAVIVLDSERRIVDLNPAARRMIDLPIPQLIGRTFFELLPDHGDLVSRLREQESGTAELVIDRGRGPEHYDIRVSSLKDGRGRIRGRMIVARDVSVQKRFEAELQQAKDAAEEASKAKSAFLATMSHELRTPLNAIIGYSEMLEEELAGEGAERLSDLRRISSAGRHLLALIDDILDLSKIEAGRMKLHLEQVNPVLMAHDLAAAVEPLMRQRANRLILQVEGAPGLLRTDPMRLRQILLNLLSNAAKFTEQGLVTLRLCAEDDGRTLVFTVSDTGIGMREEALGQLFKPFTQVDSSTTRRYSGTGLGLAISQRFCAMLGGAITVASSPGQGSTFTVRLPRAAGDEGAGERGYALSAGAATSQ